MNKRISHLGKQGYANGFTLLELLIAISLSVVLIAVLVFGLNIISRDWEKHGNKLDQKIDESLLLLQLEKAILGTFPYRYKENNRAKVQLFFEGEQNELQWISTVSPTRERGLSLWQLKIKDSGGIMINVTPVYPGNIIEQLEVGKNIENSSDYFHGYHVSLQYLSEDSSNLKQWYEQWSARDKEKLPLGVRIVFTAYNDHQLSDSLEQSFYVFSFIRVNS